MKWAQAQKSRATPLRRIGEQLNYFATARHEPWWLGPESLDGTATKISNNRQVLLLYCLGTYSPFVLQRSWMWTSPCDYVWYECKLLPSACNVFALFGDFLDFARFCAKMAFAMNHLCAKLLDLLTLAHWMHTHLFQQKRLAIDECVPFMWECS